MFKKILVAFDGSEGARKALKRAVQLARSFGAQLDAVLVEADSHQYVANLEDFDEVKKEKDSYFAQLNAEAVQLARAEGVTLIPHVLSGYAVDNICMFCREGGFDLLVVGFTGHGRIYERIWGGTSRNIARFAPCAVLIEK
jgi:nucleotide-binding universal stress UspA family protein